MEAFRRLDNLWAWLPAFRAVAEAQHLPTAAARLHVSPSALSRSIRLLEAEIDAPLFERQGRGIQLNDSGARLLVSVRNAMRGIDDAIAEPSGSLRGPVRVAATSDLCAVLVVPALQQLREVHAQLTPFVELLDVEASESNLLTGGLDIVVSAAPGHSHGVSSTCMGAIELLERVPARTTDVRRATGYTRCVYDADWSREPGTAIYASFGDAASAQACCIQGGHTLIAPTSFFDRAVSWRTLRRVGKRKLFVLHREIIGTHRRTEALLEVLAQQFRNITRARR